MKIYINGKFYPEKKAVVSVFDHGLLYGDGVFEGIRAYKGRVFKLEEHVDRLYDSAKAIAMEIPMTREAMCRAVADTCRVNKTVDGYIRLIVTRGVGTLGLNPFNCAKPQIIIIAATIQLYPESEYKNGLKVITAGTIRNMQEAVNPNIKSLNYLNNIMAKVEAINAGCKEAIMLNPQGFVAEATGDNIFAVKGNVIRTPPTSSGALIGITRQTVMDIAKSEGFDVREEVMTRYDLYTADEVFLTGTAAEVIAVSVFDARKIGDGKPGKVTRRLETLYRKMAESTGYPIYS
jgi:branched-chain amino acid aminotransferase